MPLISACIRRAAQLFGAHLLPNRRLHQRRTGQKQPAPLGHQNVVAHHRQIRASGHAHSHDRRDLRNPLGRHHRVVAEHPPKVILIRKHVFLQRQKHPRAVHQVNRRQAVFHGNVLRPDHLLRRHREERAGLHRGVVDDQHEQPSMHPSQSGHHSRRRSSAPLLIHPMRRVQSQFEQLAPFPRSSSSPIRSRAVSRCFLCCASMALAPPPSRIFASSARELRHQRPHRLHDCAVSRRIAVLPRSSVDCGGKWISTRSSAPHPSQMQTHQPTRAGANKQSQRCGSQSKTLDLRRKMFLSKERQLQPRALPLTTKPCRTSPHITHPSHRWRSSALPTRAQSHSGYFVTGGSVPNKCQSGGRK